MAIEENIVFDLLIFGPEGSLTVQQSFEKLGENVLGQGSSVEYYFFVFKDNSKNSTVGEIW